MSPFPLPPSSDKEIVTNFPKHKQNNKKVSYGAAKFSILDIPARAKYNFINVEGVSEAVLCKLCCSLWKFRLDEN